MTVRFILGSNTMSKSDVVREEIKTMLKQEPYGKPIIFIVPEQMTFQQEYALLEEEIKVVLEHRSLVSHALLLG